MSPEHCVCNPIRVYKTNYIWSSDGWVYDMISKTRKCFFTTDTSSILEMKQEKVVSSITDIEYVEEIEISILSESPLIWMEKSDTFCEVYASVSSKPKHK